MPRVMNPPRTISGPVLGLFIFSLSCFTTTLYLSHDREAKEWGHGQVANANITDGFWPPPSADFNWCELDYVHTIFVNEMWNSVTSMCFCIGPMLAWGTTTDWEVRLNLLLVAAIGLGSVVFHATLQYEGQLLDEVPMICYIVHTVALLRRKDVSCPTALKVGMVMLSAILFATPREAAVHSALRLVMVLGYTTCFVWLAYSLGRVCAELDAGARGGDKYYYTRRYQWASFTLPPVIFAWVTDNVACGALHSLPLGLPYPQLHASVWHTGMAFVCHCLCQVVVGKQKQSRKHNN